MSSHCFLNNVAFYCSEGVCNYYNHDFSTFAPEYKEFLKNFFLAQIDGFEYAAKLETNEQIIDISDEEKYGMYNCPELKKHKKINQKYHIW